MNKNNSWNQERIIQRADNTISVIQKIANLCEKINHMNYEYSKMENDKYQLQIEAEKLSLMRQEIFQNYHLEREKIVAQLIDRNEDRKYIQNVLNEAIRSNDQELKDIGFDLYKAFLERNSV